MIPGALASRENPRICSDRKQTSGCLETGGPRGKQGGPRRVLTVGMVEQVHAPVEGYQPEFLKHLWLALWQFSESLMRVHIYI